MRQQTASGFEVVHHLTGSKQHHAELDLVVPFTTPELTRQAVAAADRMGEGLNAKLRLVKIQLVPFPMELNQSPVYIDFLKDQLAQFQSALPASREIRLAREFEFALEGALTSGSVVILATLSRPWRTRNERLAAKLRHAGHKVVLIEATNA